jgi:hypothetical protein
MEPGIPHIYNFTFIRGEEQERHTEKSALDSAGSDSETDKFVIPKQQGPPIKCMQL